MNRIRFGLIFLLLLSLGFRLFHLSELSLFSDEVDAAYQATTFLRCQTDYFGHPFPLHFQSFADWRTPGFIYSLLPSLKLFGSTPFALRLPSVLASLFALYFCYLLANKLFKNQSFSLFSTLLFSFNPWFFHYSRIGFEVSLMLAFLLPGLYFLLQKKYFPSLLFFALSLYTYNTTRFFVPFFLLPQLKAILRLKKRQLLVLVIVCLPLLIDLLRHPINQRFGYINIFTDPTNRTQAAYQQNQSFLTYLNQYGHPPNMLLLRTYYSRPVFLGRIFLSRYLESFSPQFLFFQSDLNLRHGFAGKHGYFYLLDLPLILLGLYLVARYRPPFTKVLLWGLLLSPIPNSITRDGTGPHGTRLILMLPFLFILQAYSLHFLWQKSKLFLTALLPLYFLLICQFLVYYFQIYPPQSYLAWHSNLKPALQASFQQEADYPQIVYSRHPEPFLPFFVYYKPYPQTCTPLASLYHEAQIPGFTGWQLDNKYFFGVIAWPEFLAKLSRPTLIIVSDQENHPQLPSPPLYHQDGYSIFAVKPNP